jgi:hypothetical protein
LIPVAPQTEPPDFDGKVRRPGKAYLRINTNPTSKDYKNSKSEYWRLCLPELRSAYRRVCAYSSIFDPLGTVDHFRPKGAYRHLVYEWKNYRLATALINNNKAQSDVVLDPFTISAGWFILDPATLWVHPEATLAQPLKDRIQRSIDVLKLNDDPFPGYRFEVWRNYINGKLPLSEIEDRYPFIGAEIKRQGIKTAAEKAGGPTP